MHNFVDFYFKLFLKLNTTNALKAGDILWSKLIKSAEKCLMVNFFIHNNLCFKKLEQFGIVNAISLFNKLKDLLQQGNIQDQNSLWNYPSSCNEHQPMWINTHESTMVFGQETFFHCILVYK